MNEHPSKSLRQAVDKRYRQLAPRLQHLPPSGSRPLTVSGRVSGWITSRATRALVEAPGVSVLDEAVCVSAAGQRRPMNLVLENIAYTLKEAGCLRGWRGELLDVIGEGRRLGAIERVALRPLGLLTRAVHLNAWTPQGKLWIALRSSSKATDPGMWDTLVGGLAVAGESLDASLLRESNEEAGLEPDDLKDRSPLRTILRMHRRLPEGYQVEDVLVSDCVLDESVSLRNLDGEVDEFRAVSVDEALGLMHEGRFTVEAELVVLDSFRLRWPG